MSKKLKLKNCAVVADDAKVHTIILPADFLQGCNFFLSLHTCPTRQKGLFDIVRQKSGGS